VRQLRINGADTTTADVTASHLMDWLLSADFVFHNIASVAVLAATVTVPLAFKVNPVGVSLLRSMLLDLGLFL
jgi:hypothetical protein